MKARMQIPQYRCRWDNPLIAARASVYEPEDRSSGDACWLAASDAGQERRLCEGDPSDGTRRLLRRPLFKLCGTCVRIAIFHELSHADGNHTTPVPKAMPTDAGPALRSDTKRSRIDHTPRTINSEPARRGRRGKNSPAAASKAIQMANPVSGIG